MLVYLFYMSAFLWHTTIFYLAERVCVLPCYTLYILLACLNQSRIWVTPSTTTATAPQIILISVCAFIKQLLLKHQLYLTKNYHLHFYSSLKNKKQHRWVSRNLGKSSSSLTSLFALSLNYIGLFWLSFSLLINSLEYICQVSIYKHIVLKYEYVTWHKWNKSFTY